MKRDANRAYRTAQTGRRAHVSNYREGGASFNCAPGCTATGCACWCHTPADQIQKIGRNFS